MIKITKEELKRWNRIQALIFEAREKVSKEDEEFYWKWDNDKDFNSLEENLKLLTKHK